MKSLVGGVKININEALKITNFLNSISHSQKECYGYATTKDGQLFVIYNNKKHVEAVTFKYVQKHTENGVTQELVPVKVGHALIQIIKPEKRLHISFIKVEDEFKNHGIGSELLSYIETYAKEKNLKSVTLDSLCTYTNGKQTVAFRGDEEDRIKLMQIKQSGKYVDKNLLFYLKNGYRLQSGRKPEWEYLKPMIKTRIVARKPQVSKIASVVSVSVFRLKKPLVYRVPKSTSVLIQKKTKKRKQNYNALTITGGKQI